MGPIQGRFDSARDICLTGLNSDHGTQVVIDNSERHAILAKFAHRPQPFQYPHSLPETVEHRSKILRALRYRAGENAQTSALAKWFWKACYCGLVLLRPICNDRWTLCFSCLRMENHDGS